MLLFAELLRGQLLANRAAAPRDRDVCPRVMGTTSSENVHELPEITTLKTAELGYKPRSRSPTYHISAWPL